MKPFYYIIIYRDLSLNNVLIDNNLNISFLDFEYSYKIDSWNLPYERVGTLGFYDLNYKSIDYVLDIYSLGSIIYYMINFNEYEILIDYEVSSSIPYKETLEELRTLILKYESKNTYFFKILSKIFNYRYNNVNEVIEDLNIVSKRCKRYDS